MDHTSYKMYMQHALKLAQEAFAHDEVPVGALIVDKDGKVCAQAYNQTERLHTQTAHAEMLALAQAGKVQGSWRLNECVMIVTLAPCSMCMAAIKLSRISVLVYGAESPVFGFKLDNDFFLPLYNNDTLMIKSGVLADECSAILKQFFQKKRSKGEGRQEKIPKS